MVRIIITIVLLFGVAITNAQRIGKSYPTDKEAKRLMDSLNIRLEDSMRVRMLLRLAEYYLEKDGYEKNDLDSGAIFIRNAKAVYSDKMLPKWGGIITLYEGSFARQSGNIDEAKQLTIRAISELESARDQVHTVEAYLQLASCYDSKDPQQVPEITRIFNALFEIVPTKIDKEYQLFCMVEVLNYYHRKMPGDTYFMQLKFLNHLLRMYQILNEEIDEFWTRKEIADIHYKQGKIKLAIDELVQVAKEQKAGEDTRICFTYDLLAAFYIASGEYDKALQAALESIKHIHTWLDSMYIPNFYFRVASVYRRAGKISDALEWNIKSVNYLIAIKQTNSIYGLMHDVAVGMISMGRPKAALDMVLDKSKTITPAGNFEKRNRLLILVKCYIALKDNPMVEKYCEDLIKLTDLRVKLKEATDDAPLEGFLASTYLSMGQIDKAEHLYARAIRDWTKNVSTTDALWRSNFLFKLDSTKGNFLSAIKHQQTAQSISDSIFTVTKNKQLEELKIVYETDQKDNDIKILTQKELIQKSELERQAIIRNISFAIGALLIIIVSLLYNRYRLKQRTNKKLELQQLEITEQNFSLQHLLKEKEWLVKEIHHRVKNNLQIVMSLLNSQSAYIDNEPALTAIHDSQHRVHAMSLIHQKLYGSENVSSIDMSIYVRELVSYLADSFNTGQLIRFEIDVAPLEMDVSQAVPLGLILNEAITNSIKYAFPNRREGLISISLAETESHRYLLRISDNGIGMPQNGQDKKQGSLGMSLMAGLSEDLSGSFSIDSENGTKIEVSFIHDHDTKRNAGLAASFVSNN